MKAITFMKLYIKSPKLGKIKNVHTHDQQLVDRGQLLLSLGDEQERAAISKIEKAIQDNIANYSYVSGKFVLDKVEALKFIATIRLDSINQANLIYESVLEEHQVGQATAIDVIRAKREIPHCIYKALQSAIEAEIFERNTRDTLVVYEKERNLLEKELEYVENYISRLSIRAPRSGEFRRFVSEGAPVRAGHLLGILE